MVPDIIAVEDVCRAFTDVEDTVVEKWKEVDIPDWCASVERVFTSAMVVRKDTVTLNFEREAKKPGNGDLARWMKEELDVGVSELVSVEHEFGSRRVHFKLKDSKKVEELVMEDGGERLFRYEDGSTKKVTLSCAGMGLRYVRVRNLPLEAGEEELNKILSEYGRVIDCVREKYGPKSVFPGVLTGVRVARMQLKKHVPNYLRVCNLEVYVEYSGQPRTCQRCGSTQHLRAACPRGNTYAARLAAPKEPPTPLFGTGSLFDNFYGGADEGEKEVEGEKKKDAVVLESDGTGEGEKENSWSEDEDRVNRIFNQEMVEAREKVMNTTYPPLCHRVSALSGEEPADDAPAAASESAATEPAVDAGDGAAEGGAAAVAPAKMEALRVLVAEKKADVVLLQEVAAPLFNFPGYTEVVNAGENKRGTAVLVKEELETTLLLALPSGRATAVQVENITFICIYAPAGARRRQERETFFSTDIAPLLASAGEHVILGGDFNCVLEAGDNTGAPNASPALSRLTRTLQLLDVWPTLRAEAGHTFITTQSSARLDRFYCSRSLAPLLQYVETTAVASSDHLAVTCTLSGARAPPPPRRPQASWTIDATALKHPDFLPGFAREWALAVQQRADAETLTQWWLRVAKPLVRSYAAAFTRDMRRDRRNKLSFLHDSLQQLCTATPRRKEDAALIKEIKAEILELHAEAMHGVLDRAKVDSAMEDEPVSVVHVARMGQRARQQRVDAVRGVDGVEHRGQAAVAAHFLEVYRDKFSAPKPEVGGARPPTLRVDKTVSAEDNEALCRPFSKEEVLAAVKKSPRRKSPGEDGITGEFYRAAWSVIGDVFTEVLNEMWSTGSVPADIMRGIITLIPKVPRPAVVKDYRPITLLDVDAKILARILITRLAVLSDKLLHPNQVRPGGRRTMAGALCDLRDVISAVGSLGEAGCILSVDFSGAFDAVRHDYLFYVLEQRGVAKHFVDVVRSVYGAATSQMKINGALTEPFPVARSIRQGCPKSALLFAIVLAPFMQHVEERLRGVQLANSILRTSAYADDAILVLRQPGEAAFVTKTFEDFAAVSGLVANPQKTAALAAGTWNKAVNIGYTYVEEMKVLGVVFSRDVKDTIRVNWPRVLQGVRGVLTANAARALTLQQRVQFIKMMWHVAQVLPLPAGIRKDVEKALRRFLWRGHTFRVKWDVACSPRLAGGLGLPVVEKKCAALYADFVALFTCLAAPPFVLADPAKAFTAARGRPMAMAPSKGLADVTIEQPDGLDAGCIFTQRGDMYFSVSDWLLILHVHRVDNYSALINTLHNNFVKLHDDADANAPEILRSEISGMLTELAFLREELRIFNATVGGGANSTNNSSPDKPAGGGARRRRDAPTTIGVTTCSLTNASNSCGPQFTDDNDKLLTPVSGPDFWSTSTAAPQDAFRLPPIPARKRPPVRYQDPFRATTAAPRKRRPWEFQRRQESVGSMPNNAKTPVWLPRNPDLHNPTLPPPDFETTPFPDNPDNFPDLPDDFSFLAREPQPGQPLPQDFPDFPPSSHPLDTPLASSEQYASPYGIMVPKEFLDTDLTRLSLPTTPARSKRGVMHSVFGVMDSDDRSQLQDKYNEMKTKIDGLTVLQAAQTGLANVTLARFLTHDRMITALKEAIREHYSEALDHEQRFLEYAIKIRRLHALIAQPESKWIGVDELQKSHVLLSDKDLLSCHESPETPICAPAVPVHEEEDTCAMALLLSSKKAVTLCEPYLRFIKNPPPTFVSFRSGHTWAFSIQHPTNLMLTDAQGRRLNTNITQLPHTGLLHMPPFSVARLNGVALYAGSTFVSHEDLEGTVILPDIPSITFAELQLNNTFRSIYLAQLDTLLNTSSELGMDGALRLHAIKEALELPIFTRWQSYGSTLTDGLLGSICGPHAVTQGT
ncbi:hypothetical protein FOCC_FOCC016998 [Frankliniella occidentalis]|nr:hypothetical protein FOCC_FOCC016998 [Frankliniella occidentalis]